MDMNYINYNDVHENNNNNNNDNPEVVFPVNHLLLTMWKQVKVFAGGKLISSGSSNFHYKSIEHFYENFLRQHDTLINLTKNPGAYDHQKNHKDDHTFEMKGHLGEGVK